MQIQKGGIQMTYGYRIWNKVQLSFIQYCEIAQLIS